MEVGITVSHSKITSQQTRSYGRRIWVRSAACCDGLSFITLTLSEVECRGWSYKQVFHEFLSGQNERPSVSTPLTNSLELKQ